MNEHDDIWKRRDHELGKRAERFRQHHAGIYSRRLELSDEDARARGTVTDGGLMRAIRQHGSIRIEPV